MAVYDVVREWDPAKARVVTRWVPVDEGFSEPAIQQIKRLLPDAPKPSGRGDADEIYSNAFRRPIVEEFAERLLAAGLPASVTRTTDLHIAGDDIHVPS